MRVREGFRGAGGRSARGVAPRRGVTIVETTVVIGMVLLLITGIFEFGRIMMVRNLCDNAARFGARMAVVRTDSMETSELIDMIDGLLPPAAKAFDGYNKNVNIKVFKCDDNGQRIGAANDPHTWKNAGVDDRIAVEIQGVYRPFWIFPFTGGGTINMRSFSMMYSEAN